MKIEIKKKFFLQLGIMVFIGFGALTFTACGGDDDEDEPKIENTDVSDLEYAQLAALYNGWINRIKSHFEELYSYKTEDAYKQSLRDEIEAMQKEAKAVREEAAEKGYYIAKSSWETKEIDY
ncbi:MAG: hypothetical protein LIP03_09130 [Bacteroidales bacterium]|nr:hypothetical protein [Bacteroidales bacterium]